MSRPLLRSGDQGLAVKGLQFALHRSLGAWSCNLKNGHFGSRTVLDVKRFQRAHGLEVDGVVGPATWAALEPNIQGMAKKFLDGAVPADGGKSQHEVGGTRAAIVGEAKWGLAHARVFVYHQARPMAPSLKDPAAFHRTDCSAFATLCYKGAGAPDPNGLDYDGQGYTGTMWPRGHAVDDPAPGDLAFYGEQPKQPGVPGHVAVYIGAGEVISFGCTPISLRNLHYRADYRGCRSYL
jgi:hypothetical protein